MSDIGGSPVGDVPRRLLKQRLLHRPRQIPWDDLRVDRIRDAQRAALRDQPQVAHVLDVAGRAPALRAAAQQRLDDAADARFLQLVGKLVEMGLAALDELLAGLEHVVRGDCTTPVAARLAPEADLPRERVHKPRLAPGLRPDRFQRLRGEHLHGLRGVLGEQRVHLLAAPAWRATGSSTP